MCTEFGYDSSKTVDDRLRHAAPPILALAYVVCVWDSGRVAYEYIEFRAAAW